MWDQGSRGLREGGGNCLKYFKEGGAEKIGGETETFIKKEGKLGKGVGALKKGGWNPLTNYATFEQTS